MSADAIAARYANVLFELLKERGDLDDALRHFETLAQTMRREPDLGRFLLNPDVEVDEKLGVLTRVLGRDWPEDLTVFVRVVLSMGRAPHLVDIADAFRTLVDAHRHRVRVTVRTARPLSASMRQAVVQRLETLEHKHVELAEEQVPLLLGGIQVIIDHRMADGSLSAKLRELRQRLQSIRVH